MKRVEVEFTDEEYANLVDLARSAGKEPSEYLHDAGFTALEMRRRDIAESVGRWRAENPGVMEALRAFDEKFDRRRRGAA